MNHTVEQSHVDIRRDDRGRIVGDDNLPVSGLATVRETSAVLGLGLSTIYAMLNTGELPSQRFGRARRIPWTAIRARLEESQA